jgi:hypothetical protein
VKKGFGKFDDLLELYSSIIYFQNYQKLDNYNEIWKTIKKEKPHLKMYEKEGLIMFNKWIF